MMGLERLLSGALQSYCRLVRLGNAQQCLFGNASKSAQTLPSRTVTTRVSASGLCSGVFHHTGRRSLCTSAQPSRDVTLFEHDRTRFFRLLSVFCGGQLVFWTYLAHFAYTGLKDTGGTAGKEKKDKPTTTTTTTTTTTGLAGMWSFEMNLGSNTWRYGFTLGCLSIGAGIVGLGVLLCKRSVSKLVLHQGGRMVTICTQSPLGPGQGQRITVPLTQVACYAHREEFYSFIPLRVKGHKLYFLLDKEGTVNNGRLFDTTVGAYRPL